MPGAFLARLRDLSVSPGRAISAPSLLLQQTAEPVVRSGSSLRGSAPSCTCAGPRSPFRPVASRRSPESRRRSQRAAAGAWGQTGTDHADPLEGHTEAASEQRRGTNLGGRPEASDHLGVAPEGPGAGTLAGAARGKHQAGSATRVARSTERRTGCSARTPLVNRRRGSRGGWGGSRLRFRVVVVSYSPAAFWTVKVPGQCPSGYQFRARVDRRAPASPALKAKIPALCCGAVRHTSAAAVISRPNATGRLDQRGETPGRFRASTAPLASDATVAVAACAPLSTVRAAFAAVAGSPPPRCRAAAMVVAG